MSDTIRVRVVLFAMLAEAAGRRELSLEMPRGGTVADAVERLLERYPALAEEPMAQVFYAVNHTYARKDAPLEDGDELALIPPVSGGGGAPSRERSAREGDLSNGWTAAAGRFALSAAPLDPIALERLVAGPRIGAHCTFIGTVRGVTAGRRTTHLVYEAYGPMVVAEMERIAADMQERWPDVEAAMHHRVGRLEIGEAAVVIAVAAPHRDDAFAACRFGIDEVKRRCPIWKREFFADGRVEWGRSEGEPPRPGGGG